MTLGMWYFCRGRYVLMGVFIGLVDCIFNWMVLFGFIFKFVRVVFLFIDLFVVKYFGLSLS